jgi:signal transduction histidine kinase
VSTSASVPGSGLPLEESEDLPAFADFIRANREDITRQWVTAVDRSPNVPSSEDLTYRQLLDHLPQLCCDLADAIETSSAAAATARMEKHSTAHGRKRWQQGYRLDELIRELSIIRRDFVSRWFVWFERNRPSSSTEVRQKALVIVHQFFDDIITGSVTQFVEEGEERVHECEERLREAKEQAEEADRAKDHFVALVSHELRTPLTPILLGASALSEDQSLPAHLRDFVEVVRQNSHIEAGLIDDLLDASSLTRGPLHLTLTEVDLHRLLRRAVSRCRPEFTAKEITAQLKLGAAISDAQGDERRLERALTTLVRNAVSVTPPGGTVAISSHNLGSQIEIMIEDMGSTLDAQSLATLFLPFEEGRRGSPFGLGGLGLSRYVCKQIVEAHGGEITARPGSAGQGAVLGVKLPVVV